MSQHYCVIILPLKRKEGGELTENNVPSSSKKYTDISVEDKKGTAYAKGKFANV